MTTTVSASSLDWKILAALQWLVLEAVNDWNWSPTCDPELTVAAHAEPYYAAGALADFVVIESGLMTK